MPVWASRRRAELETITARLTELEEEHGGDEGAFSELDKVNKASVAARLKEIKSDKDAAAEAAVLSEWLSLNNEEAECKRRLRDAEAELDSEAYHYYPTLPQNEIKALVVDDKWHGALDAEIQREVDHVSQELAERVRELAERYGETIPAIGARVSSLEARVNHHLGRMGFSWN